MINRASIEWDLVANSLLLYTPVYPCVPLYTLNLRWEVSDILGGGQYKQQFLNFKLVGKKGDQHLPPPPQTSLCQKWLQYQDRLRADVCTNTLCMLHLKKLMLACCQSLLFDAHQSLATPLRMIEVYTSHTFYPTSTSVLVSMFSYLCSNGMCIQ